MREEGWKRREKILHGEQGETTRLTGLADSPAGSGKLDRSVQRSVSPGGSRLRIAAAVRDEEINGKPRRVWMARELVGLPVDHGNWIQAAHRNHDVTDCRRANLYQIP